MYKLRRKLLSQNFLHNRKLVQKLVHSSSIGKNDLVLEIGSGKGIITEQLLEVADEVLSIELDYQWYKHLQEKFKDKKNLNLRHGNFLDFKLPLETYKVFANIPFNTTADIIRKLIQAKNPPLDTYLIVQKEVAKKYAGKPDSNKDSLSSVLIKPWFELSTVHTFDRKDFYPFPKVDIVLLRIKQIEKPLIDNNQQQLYRDFVTYGFTQWEPSLKDGFRKIFTKTQFARLAEDLNFSLYAYPTDLDVSQWLELFNFFIKSTSNRKRQLVAGSDNRLLNQQKDLQKIHRTRTDKNWRKRRV